MVSFTHPPPKEIFSMILFAFSFFDVNIYNAKGFSLLFTNFSAQSKVSYEMIGNIGPKISSVMTFESKLTSTSIVGSILSFSLLNLPPQYTVPSFKRSITLSKCLSFTILGYDSASTPSGSIFLNCTASFSQNASLILWSTST